MTPIRSFQIKESIETDHLTFGDLLDDCCDEMARISFVEARYRISMRTGEHVSEIGNCCEKTASVIFDAIIKTALQYPGLSKKDGVTVLAYPRTLS